jgi:bacteriocin biosynthesis cyclodehydratase domain-containing protein
VLAAEQRLKIADQFSPIDLGAGQFRLQSLTSVLVLKDRATGLLQRLLPLLDGKRTVAEVLNEMGSFGEEAVRDSLQHLVEAGVVEIADRSDSSLLSAGEADRFRRQIGFFSHFVAPVEIGPRDSPVGELPRTAIEFQERLKRAHATIFGVGRLGSQLLRSLAVLGVGTITAVDSDAVDDNDLAGDAWFTATQLGINRADAAASLLRSLEIQTKFRAARMPVDQQELRNLLSACDVAVLCPDHYAPAEYLEFNRAAHAAKTTWISARFAGFEFQIGPTVIPGQSPCYECLCRRLEANVADYDEHVLLENLRSNHRIREEALAITPGAGLLALEVLKALTWFAPPATCAHLCAVNLLTLKSELHPILKIPRCPVCSGAAVSRPTIHAWQQTAADLSS